MAVRPATDWKEYIRKARHDLGFARIALHLAKIDERAILQRLISAQARVDPRIMAGDQRYAALKARMGPTLINVKNAQKQMVTRMKERVQDAEDLVGTCMSVARDLRDYEEAKGDYEKAKGDYEKAKIDYEKAKNGYEEAKSDYEKAKNGYEEAKSDYEDAKNDYEKTKDA